MIHKPTILTLALLPFLLWNTPDADAQTVELRRLDQNYKVKRSDGTRIDLSKKRKCRECLKREAIAKTKYLKRVVMAKSSGDYQKLVESTVFADQKFVNTCWRKAVDKGIEFFFTVSETGAVEDIAWFPKERAGKCIKRHIANLEFPKQEKPHYSWLVVTRMEY